MSSRNVTGPTFSELHESDPEWGNATRGTYDSEDWGLTLGADVFVSHNISVGYQTRSYDAFANSTHQISAMLHF